MEEFDAFGESEDEELAWDKNGDGEEAESEHMVINPTSVRERIDVSV